MKTYNQLITEAEERTAANRFAGMGKDFVEKLPSLATAALASFFSPKSSGQSKQVPSDTSLSPNRSKTETERSLLRVRGEEEAKRKLDTMSRKRVGPTGRQVQVAPTTFTPPRNSLKPKSPSDRSTRT